MKIERARKKNRNKRIELKLNVLSLRAEGKGPKEISEITDYNYMHVSKIVAQFIRKGLSYFTQNHYAGNRWSMTYEQEAPLLAPYLERAKKARGEVIETSKKLTLASRDSKSYPHQAKSD